MNPTKFEYYNKDIGMLRRDIAFRLTFMFLFFLAFALQLLTFIYFRIHLEMNAVMLAVGIGIQNFPEGSSVGLPLLNAGLSKGKSFLWAFISGVVEPIFAVIGFFCTDIVASILSFFLCFSAGTMIAVSCIELLPESLGENKNISTIGLGIGFCLMMFLDLMF